jgi:hypothetical protein
LHKTGPQPPPFPTLWRKLNGKSAITKADELAIRQVLSAGESGNIGIMGF